MAFWPNYAKARRRDWTCVSTDPAGEFDNVRGERDGGMMHRVVAGGLILVSVMACGGCFAPPVMLASAGLSVAQESATAYTRGQLSTAYPAPLPAVWLAALDAVEELEFDVRRTGLEESQGFITIRDTSERTTTIQFHARSPKVTKVRIRVGFWGDPALSRLIVGRISKRLLDLGLDWTLGDMGD